jgi:hypothetical protein
MLDILMDDSEYVRYEVARRLGWKSIGYSRESVLIGHAPGRHIHQSLPSYALDIRAAWDVVELLSSYGIHLRIQTISELRGSRLFSVDFMHQSKPLSHAEAAQAPLAICEAFLRIKNEQLSCMITSQQKTPAASSMGGR